MSACCFLQGRVQRRARQRLAYAFKVRAFAYPIYLALRGLYRNFPEAFWFVGLLLVGVGAFAGMAYLGGYAASQGARDARSADAPDNPPDDVPF